MIEQVLRRTGIFCQICADLDAIRLGLARDTGGILITEEALSGPQLGPLLNWCDQQPPWSDLPVIVLATRQSGHRSPVAQDILERLGNVVLLERPINAETLASAARSAIRGRRRQYEARTLLQERERNERALRELNDTLERRVEQRARDLDTAHQTLSFALDSAGMGSWELDLVSGAITRTSLHDCLFGYAEPPPRWTSETFLSHVIEDDRAAVANAFAQAKADSVLDVECRIRRTDGAVRWIAVKGRTWRDGNGQPVRMAGILMDTTDRRFTEDALHQAQKMEAIGQLTGGVAHDFNNLLTVIVSGLDMISRRPDHTERVVRLANAAMTAARRGEQLTQQLLAFSRRQMLRPQTLNPNRLLLEFEPLARRAVGEAVTLSLSLDPAADPIRIDPAQFESAVLNLIVNARDAMPGGGVITVTSRNQHRATSAADAGRLPPGPYVVISVADTGTGIDSATLARAFEPFFTTKEVGKGSGLGLSQVYGFARSCGGDVEIESEVGRGTTVSLFFPRSADALTEERASPGSKVPLRPAAAGETVLLVEDDEQVLSMAIESLEELRYRVVVAHNAHEALQHLNGPERIDIMFSDVVMPGGMNGVQLAVEARRLRPELKVLLTSGYVGDAPNQKPIAEDVVVLNKPYRRDELAQKLRVVLGRH